MERRPVRCRDKALSQISQALTRQRTLKPDARSLGIAVDRCKPAGSKKLVTASSVPMTSIVSNLYRSDDGRPAIGRATVARPTLQSPWQPRGAPSGYSFWRKEYQMVVCRSPAAQSSTLKKRHGNRQFLSPAQFCSVQAKVKRAEAGKTFASRLHYQPCIRAA
jgi:hypothetical protein